jgi:hypothetical protein
VTIQPLLLVAALLMTAPAAIAQKTPQETLDRFVALANAGELTTPEGQALLTGEAKQMATGAKSALPAADRIISIGQDKAAARFLLRDPSGGEADAYFYLEKTPQGWAVSAYRAMAMTGISVALLAELQKRPRLTAEEEFEKRNLQLSLSTDSQLRAWFAANRAAIDALAKSPTSDDTATRAKAIGVQTVNSDGKKVEIIVGGVADNIVGFVRPSSSGPPVIEPSTFIWVEDLGGGWFLYRTT